MKIIELLLYIENQAGCTISIEPMHELFHSDEQLKIPNFKTLHNHEFCRFIKSCDSNSSCAVNKHYTEKIAACGHRFCGCCPYGMWELVQPVMCRRRLMAVLYFGTFIGRGRSLQPLDGKNYDGPVPPEITPEKERVLKDWAAFFARMIQCELERALELAATAEKKHGAKYYCDIVYNLIALRYMDDLRLDDAAQACRVNPNYLSNLLKATTGKTFRQILTDQRILEAQACLKYHTDMSIGEIAASCGFKDSNYFSLVFSRRCGATPTEYRNNWRTDIRMARM